MRRLMILLSLIAFGFVWAIPAAKGAESPSFDFTTFDAPFPGAVNTEGNGINSLGQVVGDYANGRDNVIHGYLREPNGSFTMIDVTFTGAFNTFPRDINGGGTIIGGYHSPLPPPGPQGQHCFVLNAGIFTSIDVSFPNIPNTFGTRCRGINNAGEMVGFYFTPDFHRHGFFRDASGNFFSFDFPGATQTLPRRINDQRQVVGAYFDANGLTHGFLLDDKGNSKTVDFPGAVETEADAISNNGQIAGAYVDTDNHIRAFLLAVGIFTTVDLPGVIQNANGSTLNNLNFNVGIFGINDAGVITGAFLGTDGNFHGFVGVPQNSQ